MAPRIDNDLTLWYSEKAGISLPQAVLIALVFLVLVYLIKYDDYVLEGAINAKFDVTNQKLDHIMELLEKN